MNTLKPLVDQLTELIKNGTDLAKDQLPEVARQILRYETAWAVFDLISILLLIVALGFVARYCWKKAEEFDDVITARVFISAIGCLVGFFLLVIGMGDVRTLLKIHLAPKLFLIQYMAGLVK